VTNRSFGVSARPAPIRAIVVATAIGLVLRLVFALWFWVGKPLTHDEREYLALARSLAMGEGFRYPADVPGEADAQRFGRAPLYPFVLSLVGDGALVSGTPAMPPSVKIAQSVIGAAAIPIVASIAWQAAGPSAGVIAAIVTAVYPPFVWSSAYALSETLYVTLAWLTAMLVGRVLGDGSAARARSIGVMSAAGVIGGLAALTRPAMLVLLALATAWLVVSRRVRLAMVFLICTAVVIAPWTARNFREYGRLVLIASEGGITFWTGNHPLARGEGDMAANPDISRANRELRAANPGKTSEQLEPVYYRTAVGYISSHPIWWLGLVLRKAFYILLPLGPSYTLHSRLYQFATTLPYLLLLPLAAAGAIAEWRSHGQAVAVWLMFASAVVTCLVFFPQERFRIASIDPALVVWASAWLATFVAPRRGREQRS
jgi:hypothetical protein